MRATQGAELLEVGRVVVDDLEAELDRAGVQVVVARQDHLDELHAPVGVVLAGPRGAERDRASADHVAGPGREAIGQAVDHSVFYAVG